VQCAQQSGDLSPEQRAAFRLFAVGALRSADLHADWGKRRAQAISLACGGRRDGTERHVEVFLRAIERGADIREERANRRALSRGSGVTLLPRQDRSDLVAPGRVVRV
jgi:hypothetical protein